MIKIIPFTWLLWVTSAEFDRFVCAIEIDVIPQVCSWRKWTEARQQKCWRLKQNFKQ